MVRIEKRVIDKEGIEHIVTAEGTIANIPVYLIDGNWEVKGYYKDMEDIGELKSMKITKDMIDYVNLCFIDFADDNRYKHSHGSSIINIYLSILPENTITENTIEGHTNVYKWRLEQLELIESCLKKVKIEYDIFYSINFSESIESDHKIHIVVSKYRTNLRQRKL